MRTLAKQLTILLFLISLGPLSRARNEVGEDHKNNALFTAVLDRKNYYLGETATLRFTLMNRGSTPIYLAHGSLESCGRWTGYTQVRILAGTAEVHPKGGCHAAVMPIEDSHLKDVLTNSNSWVALFPGEIYGEEQLLDLPLKVGEYRLAAEIQPPRFSEAQLKILRTEGIHVLRQPHMTSSLNFKVQARP